MVRRQHPALTVEAVYSPETSRATVTVTAPGGAPVVSREVAVPNVRPATVRRNGRIVVTRHSAHSLMTAQVHCVFGQDGASDLLLQGDA